MSIASLELCKELYEMSGWEQVSHRWQPFISREGSYIAAHVGAVNLDCTPAYDLGYLLRKLPRYSLIQISDNGYTAAFGAKVYWADTPEDAAAKLCIELFKQGVLTK